jgi:hypothetical protein
MPLTTAGPMSSVVAGQTTNCANYAHSFRASSVCSPRFYARPCCQAAITAPEIPHLLIWGRVVLQEPGQQQAPRLPSSLLERTDQHCDSVKPPPTTSRPVSAGAAALKHPGSRMHALGIRSTLPRHASLQGPAHCLAVRYC